MLVSITTFSFFFIEFLSYFLTYLGYLLKRNGFFCFRTQDRDNLSEPIRKKFLFKLFQKFNSFFRRKFRNSSFNFLGINFYRNFVHNYLLVHTILLRRTSSNFTHFSDCLLTRHSLPGCINISFLVRNVKLTNLFSGLILSLIISGVIFGQESPQNLVYDRVYTAYCIR